MLITPHGGGTSVLSFFAAAGAVVMSGAKIIKWCFGASTVLHLYARCFMVKHRHSPHARSAPGPLSRATNHLLDFAFTAQSLHAWENASFASDAQWWQQKEGMVSLPVIVGKGNIVLN